MRFLSLMGKAIIGVSLLALPSSLYLLFISSNSLSAVEFFGLLVMSIFLFLGGIYAGLLGIRTDELASRLEALSRPRGKITGGNLMKAICPVDRKKVVFVHVSPHRDDAFPDGLDLFLGACGHQVHRSEIEIANQ